MKKEIADRWVAELRSGKWTQIDGLLGKGDTGRCCLGVLCEVAVQDGIIGKELDFQGSPSGSLRVVYDDEHQRRSGETLPPDVRDWAGIDTDNPKIRVNGKSVPLSIVNDYNFSPSSKGSGLTFEQIADAIAEQYEEL
jgi:hypothetical protein